MVVATASLLLLGLSCGTSADKSWDSPEDFVLNDVERYVSLALENNQEQLEKEYGYELAGRGFTIWHHYSFGGSKPTILEIDRFADGCWVILTDTVIGAPGDVIYDESTFYYVFRNDRWQLMQIETSIYNQNGTENRDARMTLQRDIPLK